MTTPADLLPTIAPELADADPAALATHIELAEAQTGKVFGKARDYTVALLAAHTMTLAGREGFGGAVASKKEGQLAVGFHAAGSGSPLSATSYGAELERLRRSYIMGARTIFV